MSLRYLATLTLAGISTRRRRYQGNGTALVNSGALLMETTGFLLLEDGTSHFLFG
jgi:hypothetical protein